MNKKLLFLIVLTVAIMCSGCSEKITERTIDVTHKPFGQDPNKLYVEEKLGIIVDNDTPLNQLLTKEYELSALQEFFGKDSGTEGFLSEDHDVKHPSSHEVLQHFPIECLRYEGSTYYSVYKIKNGGYYYILWNGVLQNPENYNFIVRKAICINNPASLDTLQKLIQRNKTTVGKILDVAPETVMDFMSSSGPYSYTLLDDMRVLVIRYYNKGDRITRDTLVVMEAEIVTLNSIFANAFNTIRNDIYLLPKI